MRKNSSLSSIPTNDQPTALVVSFNPLLGFYLSQKLSDENIAVYLLNLPPSPSSLPLSASIVQISNTSSLDYSDFRPDYLCLLYPSLANSDQLEELTASLSGFKGKILLVDQFQSRFFEPTDFLNSSQNQLRRVYVTHPYGDLRLSSSSDRVHQILSLASEGAHLTLQNQGQNLLFPTYISDLIPPLLRILFSSGAQHPIYWLSSLDQVSELDLSYLAQSQALEVFGTNLSLDFSSQPTPISTPDRSAIAQTQLLLNWTPKVEIKEGIDLTFRHYQPAPAGTFPEISIPEPEPDLEENPHTVAKNTSTSTTKRKLKHLRNILARAKHALISRTIAPFIPFVLLILIILVAPPALTYFSAYRGATTLRRAVTTLEAGETKKTKDLALAAGKRFAFSRQFLTYTRSLYFFLPLRPTFKKHDQLLDAGERLSEVLGTATDSVDQATSLYRTLVSQETADLNSLLPTLTANLTHLHTQLSLVETSLKDVDFSSRLPYLDPLKKTYQKLPDLRHRLQLGIALLELLPSTINSTTPKNYLLLLQNSTELRPSGGFISAFAVLTFTSGRLVDVSVSDIYSADSKLQGRIEPPPPLKKYLEENWYARDSNWFPNFTASARQVQWFLQKELGQSYDGVVALDLFGLKYLLSATGPISRPELGEIVSEENFFEVINRRSQVDFSATTATGQDFLTSLFRSTLDQIRTGQVPLSKLAKAIDLSLGQQSLLVSLNDPKLQSTIETQNWSGSLRNPPCPAQFSDSPCTSETFALIEANLGINRSNYFLNRQIHHQVNVGLQGQLSHQISIIYQNTSPGTQWPGGKYKTYTRFFAPLNTQILEVKLDDQPLEFEATPSTSNPNLLEIGLFYEIPVGATANLSLSLASPSILSTLTKSTSLSINWENQPGSATTPLKLEINYPEFLTPTLLSLPAASNPSQLIFTLPLNSDSTFAAKFSR